MADGINNPLRLDPKLEKELREKGLAWRFISAKKYLNDSGFHRQGYSPYQREKPAASERKGSLDFSRGVDPEGYIRYKDLVLAVKPQEDKDRYLARLKKTNERYMATGSKQKAAELRERAKSAGVDMRIEDGYEDEGEAAE